MDPERLWSTVLGELELLVTKPTFRTFFAPTKLVVVESGVATIGCNSAVAVQMMESRYYNLIKNLLDKHTKQNTSLLFKIVAAKGVVDGPLFSQAVFSPPSGPNTYTRASNPAHLRTDFIFETFAVSTTNQMAYAAATAVAQSPGVSYNPLFFYGGVGVGKTHLMQAIGTDIYTKHPSFKIIYCTGEEFTNEFIDAIQTKTTRRFKDKYRSSKVLLIDDIQFIEGKMRVQEEFFHTFNTVQREGGQVVLTSDRPPHEIDRLEERLKSRFEGGLLVDVQKPDFELRCAILRIKAQQKGINLPMSITQILAANVDSIRKLEGLLTRIVSETQVKKIPLSEELARSVVGKPEVSAQDMKSRVAPMVIFDAVMRRYNLTLTQIKSSKRNRPLARPRQVLMYLLRTELGLPLDEVGTWVGGRDHTTVIHAVDTITSLLLTNEALRDDVLWIKNLFLG